MVENLNKATQDPPKLLNRKHLPTTNWRDLNLSPQLLSFVLQRSLPHDFLITI